MKLIELLMFSTIYKNLVSPNTAGPQCQTTFPNLIVTWYLASFRRNCPVIFCAVRVPPLILFTFAEDHGLWLGLYSNCSITVEENDDPARTIYFGAGEAAF